MRGRPRKHNPNAPAHINQKSLPDYCYWDNSGTGHWYTVFSDNGKQRRKKIGDSESKVSDLHRAIEERVQDDYNNLVWLHSKFVKSDKFGAVSQSQRDAWEYALSILSKHPTKKRGMMLSHIPLEGWSPQLTQKVMDSVGKRNGPTAAKRVREYLRKIFNWGYLRDHCPPDPVGNPEMPKERKRQRLPDLQVVKRLERFARVRGTQAKTAGSCAPYIWSALVISRKCRLRGIEVFTSTEAHLLEKGVDCQRRKGSRANITEYDELLEDAIDAAIERRRAIFAKKGKATPIRPEDRLIMVNTSGQRITKSAWQNAWRRFLDLAVKEGVIKEEDRFGLHDMKRRGITDTEGTRADRLEASGLSDYKILSTYDKSKAVVKPAPG